MTARNGKGQESVARVVGVTKIVGDGSERRVIVQDCTFDVEPDRLTVLVGPSACGKTTLINMIAGYDRQSAGEILLEGGPVRGPGPDRLVVFQETALFPWMTVAENVMYGPAVQRRQEKRKVKERAMALLSRVGLAEFATKYPMQLSGGMQRRAELARALINSPRLLMMDEPFRGLDHMTRELMQEYLLKLFEERRATIVFVTSEIDEAIFLGDCVVVLSSAPATVKRTIDVGLARPRRRTEVLASQRYKDIKREILDTLYGEAAKALSVAHDSRRIPEKLG